MGTTILNRWPKNINKKRHQKQVGNRAFGYLCVDAKTRFFITNETKKNCFFCCSLVSDFFKSYAVVLLCWYGFYRLLCRIDFLSIAESAFRWFVEYTHSSKRKKKLFILSISILLTIILCKMLFSVIRHYFFCFFLLVSFVPFGQFQYAVTISNWNFQ